MIKPGEPVQKLISTVKYKGQDLLYETVTIYILVKRMILDLYHFIRSQSQLTKLFGTQYKRSYRSIEIDITYRCNLKCINCNRSCSQAPSKEEMKVEQIEEFIKESIKKNIKWEQVKLLGGEPTLHTRLFTIIRLLLLYKNIHNPDMRIVIATNGFGDYVKSILTKLPKEIDIQNTHKSPKNPRFFSFNMAPKDNFLYNNVDYSNGCRIIAEDGIGLTPYGYYHCAIAGGIDRILNFDIGRRRLPSQNDLMIDQLKTFCMFCGHFGFSLPTRKEKISHSWKMAYKLYNERQNNGQNNESKN